jgi:hypothetical protein
LILAVNSSHGHGESQMRHDACHPCNRMASDLCRGRDSHLPCMCPGFRRLHYSLLCRYSGSFCYSTTLIVSSTRLEFSTERIFTWLAPRRSKAARGIAGIIYGNRGMPNPVAGSSPAASISTAILRRYARVAAAFPCQSFAASPAICGVAIDVPESA